MLRLVNERSRKHRRVLLQSRDMFADNSHLAAWRLLLGAREV